MREKIISLLLVSFCMYASETTSDYDISIVDHYDIFYYMYERESRELSREFSQPSIRLTQDILRHHDSLNKTSLNRTILLWNCFNRE